MNIKKIIGIISCKGGVGKSTLAINIALALKIYHQKKVGLLDADIYGPNHPSMLGINNLQENINDQILYPKEKFGILSMSMGYFLNENSAVLLRGPMISNTIKYLFNKTNWGDLDYLIIDFPPGTGDVYLSLLRDLTFDGAILITTPQTSSIEDLKRSINMLKKFDIKIFSLIENMKYYTCKNCNHKNNLISDNKKFVNLIKEFDIKNIYSLPYDDNISESFNIGIPLIVSQPENISSKIFKNISNIII